MKGLPVFFSLSLIAISIPVVSRGDTLVPAGTLLSCTISEPNFSSKTADIGDPILCYASPVAALGRTVLPYGTYLVGRFQDYRDPGHFVGKGWMELNFDRMVSAPDRVIPIEAKVVHVPGYRVDKKGRILGRGHAVRDTVEWLIPILWPIKILTLPARGPRPVLKSETRMTLKLMDDTLIPGGGSLRGALPRSLYPSSAYAPPRNYQTAPGNYPAALIARNEGWAQGPRAVSAGSIAIAPQPQMAVASVAPPRPKDLTMLIRKDGSVNLASDYWLEGSVRLRYVAADGSLGEIPIENLDLAMTVATNQRRGLNFTLRSARPARPQ